MQIVIDIDEETYKDIKRGKIYSSYRDVPQESVVAIANGTPLPKGHGRLIDVIKLKAKMFGLPKKSNRAYWDGVDDVGDLIDKATTIIEADKEDNDADSD